METHADDPIDQPEPDPWDKMTEQLASLGRKLRDTYQQSMTDSPPDQEEIKAALRTLGNAWEKVVQAVGTAARDEEVKANMKSAATGFFEAVGAAFSELGAEIRRSRPDDTVEEGESVNSADDESGPRAGAGIES